jgi:hypothetical protein
MENYAVIWGVAHQKNWHKNSLRARLARLTEMAGDGS